VDRKRKPSPLLTVRIGRLLASKLLLSGGAPPGRGLRATMTDARDLIRTVNIGHACVYDLTSKAADSPALSRGCEDDVTAPGCGMGPVLTQDVQKQTPFPRAVDEANVELVWEPQWNKA